MRAHIVTFASHESGISSIEERLTAAAQEASSSL